MRFRLHPLTLALALAGLSAQASATDLVQAYDLARNSDPQFASSEALRNAQQEGVVQSRAALLPQVTADVTYGHSEISSSGSQVFNGVTTGTNSSSNESSRRGSGVNVQQSIFDFGNVRLERADALTWQPGRQFDAIAVTGAVAEIPSAFTEWLRPGGRMFVVRGRSPVQEAVRATRRGEALHLESLFETDIPYLRGAAPAPAFHF